MRLEGGQRELVFKVEELEVLGFARNIIASSCSESSAIEATAQCATLAQGNLTVTKLLQHKVTREDKARRRSVTEVGEPYEELRSLRSDTAVMTKPCGLNSLWWWMFADTEEI